MIRIERRILSPTAINTYLTCPRKFYLRYIKKLPGRPSIHLIRGSLVHKTLHDFHVNLSRIIPHTDSEAIGTALTGIFQRHWQAEKTALESLGLSKEHLEDYRRDSTDMLTTYARWFARQRAPPVVDATELKIFSVPLRLMGVIDAVKIQGGETFLTDYKTSKNSVITEDITRQAIIYSLLYRDRYGDMPAAVYIHFLKDPGDPAVLYMDDIQLEYGKILIDAIRKKTGTTDEKDYPCTCGGTCERDFITGP